jgi:hypothetical protein
VDLQAALETANAARRAAEDTIEHLMRPTGPAAAAAAAAATTSNAAAAAYGGGGGGGAVSRGGYRLGAGLEPSAQRWRWQGGVQQGRWHDDDEASGGLRGGERGSADDGDLSDVQLYEAVRLRWAARQQATAAAPGGPRYYGRGGGGGGSGRT